jgi:mRNA-degrading endonuclease toxin of MazEF toxin-antitoxin module
VAHGKKQHAWYVPPTGPASTPYLPNLAGLYWVDTLLYGNDPAPRRPAVVLTVSTAAHAPIQIMTRTTDLTTDGVPHPRQPDLGLDEGVFSDLRNVDKHRWHAPRIAPIGTLDPETMAEVLRRFS